MDEWVDQWSAPEKPQAHAAKKATSKKATGQEEGRPQTARRIGANPNRRYGSAGSRSLGR